MTSRRRPAEIVPLALASVLASYTFRTWADPSGSTRNLLGDIAVTVVVICALIAWGILEGSRLELAESWRQRALAAEEAQRLQALAVEAQERERLAREMHDTLAHGLSLIALHSGALTTGAPTSDR